jgi:DNA-binding CsgD family transcriptional regulator
MSTEDRKKDTQIRPHSFALCERGTGIVRFRVDANPDGSLPGEKIASLLAIHCLVRDQSPNDFELMILPHESLLKSVNERVQQLLTAGRAIGRSTKISPREHEVLTGVVQNLANKEIAAKLNVSERTVKFHVSSLLIKFGVTNRVELSREVIFGRIPDCDAMPEVDDQTLFGYPVKVGPTGRVENANIPNPRQKQHDPVRQMPRPRARGISTVARERFAN